MSMHPQPGRVRRPAFIARVPTLVALVVLLAACGSQEPAPSAPGPAVQAAPTTVPGTNNAPPAAGNVGVGQPAPVTPGGQPSAVRQAPSGPFPNGLLIADRGNGRLLVVSNQGRVLWHFPVAGSLPAGQQFSADDAFVAPDGKTIVANDESHEVIDRIDIATRKVIWQYGHYAQAGSRRGYLHTPDDAYPLANGNIVVADIMNCRILEISPAKRVVHQFGQTGVCSDQPPTSYGEPNGDTPLPDGGLLITEIRGSRVVRLSRTGRVVFDIHVPAIYPSDAQLDAHGNVIVADYANPGAVIAVSPKGRVLWRYAPSSGRRRLDHPSLATPLPNGLIVVNDDFRHRVVVINPRTQRIVWQYGRTDVAGRHHGMLFVPDGHQPVPPGVTF